jgi:hypothetical protein
MGFEMKENLIGIIKKIINLLEQCGYYEKSEWFKKKMEVFLKHSVESNPFQSELKEVKSIIGGMGSFSDLSMTPNEGSKLTKNEARKMQWELADDLFEEIECLLM